MPTFNKSKRTSPAMPVKATVAFAVVLALVLTLLCGCSVSPTGRTQFTALPAQQLNSMGAQSFEQMKQQMSIERGASVNRYVRCVADALTREVDRGSWEVVVFEDDSANAFALPGGKIGVHTGLLNVAKNQHQLAAVIGHEIGHVQARHANERVSQSTVAQLVLSGASAYLGAKGVGARTEIMQALGLGAQVGFIKPFSRTHESEADVIGQDLMARAGFDPRESVQLWRNMKAEGGATPPELLSTHPAPDTRISDLQQRMDAALQIYRRAQDNGRRPNCR